MGYVFALKASAVQTFIESPTLSLDDGAIGWDAGEYVQVDFEVSSGTPTVQWFYFTNPADIDGTKTNISAGAVAPAALLPVSAPNAYRAAYFMDTATFGGANADTRYIGCDVTIGATTERATYTVAAIGDIVGTPISQSTVGDGPHVLSSTGTYYLSEDITTTGSAFFVDGDNTVINLNGHTITFDDEAPVEVVNHSFETVDPGDSNLADNWDFTNAPNATRFEGTFTDYQLSKVADGNCSLRFAAASIADGVDEYVTNDTPITLQPNTTYCITAQFMYGTSANNNPPSNPGVVGYVQLMDGATPVGRIEVSSTFFRGIQLFPYGWKNTLDARGIEKFQFTTGATPPSYTLRVGVIGKTGAAHDFWIDRIRVVRTFRYGVSTSVGASQWYPDATSSVAATNVTVKNGSITQGSGNSTASRAVSVSNQAIALHRVNATVAGDDALVLECWDATTKYQTVKDCTLTNNATTLSNRDNFTAGVLIKYRGEVARCQVLNSPHAGITTNGDGCLVYGNTIKIKSSRYTNGFAINAGRDALVYDNIIDNASGEHSGRGIGLGGDSSLIDPLKCYNNRISVKYYATSQEYGGVPLGGAYGIQIESGTGSPAKNLQVYSNSVTAYGDEVSAWAFRANNTGTGVMENVLVHDNTFTGVNQGSRSAPLKLSGDTNYLDTTQISIYDNHLVTNDCICGDATKIDIAATGCTIEASDVVASPREMTIEFGPLELHSTLQLVNPTFADSASRLYLEGATVHKADRYGVGFSTYGALEIAWSTVIDANLSGGAAEVGSAVSVEDVSATEVATGTTDSNGQVTATIKQQTALGGTITNHNDHTAYVDDGIAIMSTTFTADQAQTITLMRS